MVNSRGATNIVKNSKIRMQPGVREVASNANTDDKADDDQVIGKSYLPLPLSSSSRFLSTGAGNIKLFTTAIS